MLSAIMRGGESVGSTAAKGLSDARRGFRVVITASTGWRDAARADAMSVLFRGDPDTVVRLDWLGWLAMISLFLRVSGLRTRAVMVWLRFRASFRTRRPVRPVAPRRRICILYVGRGVVWCVGYGRGQEGDGCGGDGCVVECLEWTGILVISLEKGSLAS